MAGGGRVMPVLFGSDEGTDWPTCPPASSAPQELGPGGNPDTDPAWTQEIDGVYEDSDWPTPEDLLAGAREEEWLRAVLPDGIVWRVEGSRGA